MFVEMNDRTSRDNTDISLGGVKKICSKLQEFGMFERIRSKRDGFWKTK